MKKIILVLGVLFFAHCASSAQELFRLSGLFNHKANADSILALISKREHVLLDSLWIVQKELDFYNDCVAKHFGHLPKGFIKEWSKVETEQEWILAELSSVPELRSYWFYQKTLKRKKRYTP